MFYQKEEVDFIDPSKIKAYSIPMSGAGFALWPTGEKIETRNPGPGHYLLWFNTESPEYTIPKELKFSDFWKSLQSTSNSFGPRVVR